MKFISRKAHAVMDYVVGVLLIIAPWLFGFYEYEAARWCAIGVGVLTLVMSLMTDNEGGMVKIISMNTHLNMDILVGIFLALSPWIFNFNELVYLPHLIVGIFAICAGIFTVRVSQHSSITGVDMGPAH